MPDQPGKPGQTGKPDDNAPGGNSKTQAESAKPVSSRPEQSAEDTDIGWGDRPESDHDERYQQDRPPHWGSD